MSNIVEQTWMDVRVGARSLFRDRSFTVVSALTLAIGVAVNATMFSVVNAVLLRPPSYTHPEQLVVIGNRPPNGQVSFVAPAEFLDYRRLSQSMAQIAQTQSFNANITGGDRPDRVDAVAVSPNFFTLLGAASEIGRTFVPADEQPGFTQIAAISHGLWERLFAASPAVIGRKIRLDDDDYTIVGVMPSSFAHPIDKPGAPIDVWLPAGFQGAPWPTPATRANAVGLVIGRMKPGVSLNDVRNDFARIDAELVATYPDNYGGAGSNWAIDVSPLHDVMAHDTGRALGLLLGAVGFILLIACANVASLLLARTRSRTTEIAVRAAIGADRGRLVRALLAEHLTLVLIGGVGGVMLTVAGVGAVRALAPSALPRRADISVDWRVLVFALGCSIIAGLLVGVAPALVGSRTPLSSILRGGGRGATGGAGHRVRGGLVVFQLALSVVLLGGAGLVARSFWKIEQVDLGFSPDHLLTADITVSLPNDRNLGRYVAPQARAQFFETVLTRMRALPGVQFAAGANAVPLRDDAPQVPIGVEGQAALPPTQLPRATLRQVSADYFPAMRTRIVRGQGISDHDLLGMPLNAVITETAARHLFPNTDPIGKRFKRGPVESPAPWITVVGVAADSRFKSADADPGNVIYIGLAQSPPVTLAILLRTSQDPSALASQVASVVHSVDPEQPVYRVETMESVVYAAVGQRRFAASLFVTFAVLALLLAAVGVYGLIAQSIIHRRREIGVRMALGANSVAVLWMIVRNALSLAAAGAVVGLLLAIPLSRLLVTQLFDVSPFDPLVFGSVVPTLCVVAMIASYLPARAAARLNPVSALQAD